MNNNLERLEKIQELTKNRDELTEELNKLKAELENVKFELVRQSHRCDHVNVKIVFHSKRKYSSIVDGCLFCKALSEKSNYPTINLSNEQDSYDSYTELYDIWNKKVEELQELAKAKITENPNLSTEELIDMLTIIANKKEVRKKYKLLQKSIGSEHSLIHRKAGEQDVFGQYGRKSGNMPQEFGKIRPLKTTHSPTMTP